MAVRTTEGGRARKVAATYSRVSGVADPREASLDTQEEAQVRMWEEKGWVVPPGYRFRERYTGMESIYDRPVLGHIRDLAAGGRIDGFSAYDTDRLARDPQHLLIVYADARKRGVEVEFVNCSADFKGRIGEMTLYMKGFASALQWDAILDCTTRGRLKISRQGLNVGYGSVKYGYIWIKAERRRVADPDAAPVVVQIFESLADGMSTAWVAAELNRRGIDPPSAHAGRKNAAARWWPSCVHRLVRDRTYLGEAFERRTVSGTGRRKDGHADRVRLDPADLVPLADGRTEALVSRELFDRAHRAMAAAGTRARRGRPADPSSHLLAGVVFCGRCGARMTPHSNVAARRDGTGRRCNQYRCFGSRLKESTGCTYVVGAGWVEAAAWGEIEKKLLLPGWLEAEAARLVEEDSSSLLRSDLATAEARRAEVARKIEELIDLQIEHAGKRAAREAFADRLATLEAQAQDLDAHLADLGDRIALAGSRGAVVADLLRRVEDVRRRARAGLSAGEKRLVIEALDVDVVVFDRPRVQVRLPFGRSPTSARTPMSARESGTTPEGSFIAIDSAAA
jgi:DNA invertase Pin-like site-specific DNA recombinase